MNELDCSDWEYLGTWPDFSFADADIWLGTAAVRRFHDMFGFWKGNANVFTGGGRGSSCHSFVRTKTLDFVDRYVGKALEEGGDVLSRPLERYYKAAEEYHRAGWQLLALDLTALDDVTLADVFLQARDLQRDIAVYDQLGIFTERAFQRRVTEILAARVPDLGERLCYFSAILAPWTEPMIRQEERAMLRVWDRLLSTMLTIPGGHDRRTIRTSLATHAAADVEALAHDFGWHRVFLRNPGFTADYYFRELTSLALEHGSALPEYVRSQLAELDALPARRRARAQTLYAELELRPEERLTFDLYRLAMDARNEASAQIGLGSLIVMRVEEEFRARLAVDEDVFHALHDVEVAEVLRGVRPLSAFPIAERAEIAGFWFRNGREFVEMLPGEARDFLVSKRGQPRDSSDVERRAPLTRGAPAGDPSTPVVRGTCASPGRARGPACIIRSVSEFSKFHPGDILIAETTTVDYAPLMRRAAGIITEHGGVTSHAAIVARELGKPAIVGYRSASMAFRDGDVISFDTAENGIVHVEPSSHP